MPSLVDAMAAAFEAYSNGRAELPSVIHLDVPESGGEIHVKAGHLHGAPRYAIKVSSGFYGSGRPAYGGLVLVFDAADGRLDAILLDGGYVTDARTGAAGGLAARLLAPETVRTVGVLGTGLQAAYQLEGLAAVRSFDRVRVWGRAADRAAARVEDLRTRGLPARDVDVVATPEEAVREADVVVTCTASREPLVRAEWLRPGAHVTAVGSDGPGKQELDVEVLARAGVVVADSRDQCARLGELQHAVADGAVSLDAVPELGEIVAGRRSGRTAEDQITIADLTGVGVQDVAAAALVLERLPEGGDRIPV
jgi:ornithine cyclodeaminase